MGCLTGKMSRRAGVASQLPVMYLILGVAASGEPVFHGLHPKSVGDALAVELCARGCGLYRKVFVSLPLPRHGITFYYKIGF